MHCCCIRKGNLTLFPHPPRPTPVSQIEQFVLEGLVEVFYFSGNSWQLDAPRYNSSSRAFLSPQTWAYDNCFRSELPPRRRRLRSLYLPCM